MSVSSTTSSISYTGNASTSTAYPVPFQFFDSTDLVVVRVDSGVPTTLVNGTGYTVSGGGGSTGSITTTTAIPSTSTVVITRQTAKTQLTSYTTGDRFPASAQEKALDKLTMIAQEATAIPTTATASGAAPYVLQASSVGATPAWVPQTSGGIAAGSITNAMLAGSIMPSKLSTGAPSWTSGGTVSATVFSGPLTGAVTGNADSATKLATPRTISLSGDVTGSASFDGSANATIAATISAGSVVTADIANNAITAAKLGTNEQKQIAKAWVNFNGQGTLSGTYVQSGGSATVTFSQPHGLVVGTTVQFTPTSGGAPAGGTSVTSVPSSTQIVVGTAAGSYSGNVTITTALIRSSYNVSSITKSGVGQYTINYTNAMTDANYSVSASYGGIGNPVGTLTVAGYQTTSVQVFSTYYNGSTGGNIQDAPNVSLMVFGN